MRCYLLARPALNKYPFLEIQLIQLTQTYPVIKLKLVLFPCLLLSLFLAACNSAARLNQIRIGMTKSDVVQVLGQPDSTSAQANIEYLTYYLYTDSSSYRDERPYSVRLVDGKVESFGRFTQLLDVYYRPVAGQASPLNPYLQQPVPVPAGTPAPSAGSTLTAELTKLNNLRMQGALTEEEFQKAKQKLLNSDQK